MKILFPSINKGCGDTLENELLRVLPIAMILYHVPNVQRQSGLDSPF